MSAVKDSAGPVFAGIDIGGTSIKWMIVDESGTILTQPWPSRWDESARDSRATIRDWSVSA